MSLGLIVLQAFTRRNVAWWALGIGWHTVVGAVAVYAASTWGIYVTELVVGGMALVRIGVIHRLKSERNDLEMSTVDKLGENVQNSGGEKRRKETYPRSGWGTVVMSRREEKAGIRNRTSVLLRGYEDRRAGPLGLLRTRTLSVRYHLQSRTNEIYNHPMRSEMEERMKITKIEGIGARFANTLIKSGVSTTRGLLKVAATKAGRQKLAKSTGISETLILEWVNLADLMRIKGVGEEYSDLLEEAGVDSVRELRNRVPDHLHKKMVEINKQKRLVRREPSLVEVRRWVEQAKMLKPVVTH